MRKAIAFLIAVAIALWPALSHTPQVPTSASPATDGPTRFAVIGDYGKAGPDELAVANLVKSWSPDLIITTGDNNWPDGVEATIDANIGQYYADYIYPYSSSTYTSTATTNRFFPSLGNHDWQTGTIEPHLAYFTLPNNERYYDFTWGPIRFFAIDSDPHEWDGRSSSSVQAIWLRGRLASSTSCWNLVYFHHAPYSSGYHGSDTVMQWQFREWGADAVLAGHDHDYERIILNGFPYFVVGLGGVSIRECEEALIPGSQICYDDTYGAMRVTATPNTLTYEFIATDGATVDTYIQNGGCTVYLPLVVK